MDETTLGMIILVVLVAGLIGVAYFLDKRRKKHGPIGGAAMQVPLPPPGPVAKILKYINYGLIVACALALLGGFIFHTTILYYIGGACLVIAFILGRVRFIARISGK